ncbi:MAG: insulinase family protein [Oscillospiraceae bacterium]|jgi:predicted Zn-dependent peptidase|nr:insulinase family protein [Oscillospiraceae bacterium]
MSSVVTSFICEGVNFNYIKQSSFKSERVSVSMFVPLEKQNASKNSVLFFLLSKSCLKYPDFTSFNKKLSNLYGMVLSSDVGKLGEVQVLTLQADFFDSRYALNNESISQEASELLCETLFKPKFSSKEVFWDDDFAQEKDQLIQLIDSEYNDKKHYSLIRCFEIMCENEKFSIGRFGSREDVLAVEKSDIIDSWNSLLSKARIEINMTGNSDPKNVLNLFKNNFKNIKRENIYKCETKITKKAKEVKYFQEKQEINQAKLVMGFRTKFAFPDNFFATIVMNTVFGATSNSKLFLNVREKMSLCYYCSSYYEKNKGIMVVQSGIKRENIDKTKEEVLKQFEKMKNGEFTEEDINTAKLNLKGSLFSIYDSINRINDFFLVQSLQEKKYSPETFFLELKKVNKSQIIGAAKVVTLDTIYTLVPES